MKTIVVQLVVAALLVAAPGVSAQAESLIEKISNVIIIIEPVRPRFPDPPRRPCDCEKDRSCGK